VYIQVLLQHLPGRTEARKISNQDIRAVADIRTWFLPNEIKKHYGLSRLVQLHLRRSA
jgi:hypothetical protein